MGCDGVSKRGRKGYQEGEAPTERSKETEIENQNKGAKPYLDVRAYRHCILRLVDRSSES